MKPYQNELPAGATVVAWNETHVVWRPQRPTFHDTPYNVHPVNGKRITGSGLYDLSGTEVKTITGLSL